MNEEKLRQKTEEEETDGDMETVEGWKIFVIPKNQQHCKGLENYIFTKTESVLPSAKKIEFVCYLLMCQHITNLYVGISEI